MMTDNQGNNGKIQGILLCQFHPDEGPKIVYQHPADHVTSETFKLLQAYLCPKEELTQKLITVKAFNHKILGCPIYINNKKLYKRNNFIFNVCFIFHPQTKTSSYEPILKKLTDTLAVIETESGYLSLASGRDVYYVEPDNPFSFPNKQFITTVHQLLYQVMEDINTNRCATIPIDDVNTINLKLVDSRIVPVDVRDHHVPVLLFTPEHYVEHEWDLATRQIIPYIDGIKHVGRISKEANINIRLLRTVIRNLMFAKLVTITPIFQVSFLVMLSS